MFEEIIAAGEVSLTTERWRTRELGVSCRARSCASDVLADEVYLEGELSLSSFAHLLAVLVRDNLALGRSRVRADDDAVVEQTTNDRRTCRRRLGHFDLAFGRQSAQQDRASRAGEVEAGLRV